MAIEIEERYLYNRMSLHYSNNKRAYAEPNLVELIAGVPALPGTENRVMCATVE
jgi:hypothetical protein